jgi:hypothetical protein
LDISKHDRLAPYLGHERYAKLIDRLEYLEPGGARSRKGVWGGSALV